MAHPIIAELKSRISSLAETVDKLRKIGGTTAHYQADVMEGSKNRLEQRLYEINLSEVR